MRLFSVVISALLFYSVAFSQNCVDPSQINPGALCTFIYDPVCGCDGKTYSNDCEAYYYGGVTSWTPGPCQGTTPCAASFTSKLDSAGRGVQFTNLSVGSSLTYAWDFGDSSVSAQANPHHVYGSGGGNIFYACLTVTDAAAACSDTYCDYVFLSLDCIDTSLINPMMGCPDIYAPVCGCDGVTYSSACDAMYGAGVASWTQGECFPNSECHAYFSFFADSANPLEIYFIGPSFGFIQQFLWDFGDGSTSTDETPAHTYSSAGIYDVCITVSEASSGCSDTYCAAIYAGSSACVDSAVIDTGMACPRIYDPVCGCDGVTYSNSCEALYQHGVTSFYPGECWVDDKCFAWFWYEQDSSNLPHVQFYDGSSGPNTPGNVTGWLWDFGDGSTSTEQNPYHIYTDTTQSEFLVCLTVSDSINECSEIYCSYVYTKQVPWNPCGINFGWGVDSATGVVNFADPATGDTTKNYLWDFGDGTVSSDPNPAHGYSEEGYYYPCLTVYGPNDSCVYCDTIYALAERLTGISTINRATLKLKISPNPLRENSVISYTLPIASTVSIYVIDMMGRRTSLLENVRQPKGTQVLNWSVHLPAGIYAVEINAGGLRETLRTSVFR